MSRYPVRKCSDCRGTFEPSRPFHARCPDCQKVWMGKACRVCFREVATNTTKTGDYRERVPGLLGRHRGTM